MSHAGHGAPGRNGRTVFTVDDQIEHKVAFLRGLVTGTWPELADNDCSEQPNRFVLMGHSIGAFIALKTWNRVANTNVSVLDAMLLMPTICELYQGYSFFNRVRRLPFHLVLMHLPPQRPLTAASPHHA